MNRVAQIEILLDLTRLVKKHGRKSLEELADLLDSSEDRAQLISLLRTGAEVARGASRAASKTKRTGGGERKLATADDPERSLEAWSRLIMQGMQPNRSKARSESSVKGRVTFDERGRIIGSGGNVPTSWSGMIPVVVEVRTPKGDFVSRTIQVDAGNYLARLARRAPLRDYPEYVTE